MSRSRAVGVGAAVAAGTALVGAAGYLGLVTGAMPLDLGVGRRTRPLGPLQVRIDAPRDTVFAMVRAPYAERAPRALREKVQVWERGDDMVLAAHFTPVVGRLRATTVETVRFEPPERVEFRLVRGPVPYVRETFQLSEDDDVTLLTYTGELATDLWAAGEWWGNAVAARWEATVQDSLDTLQREAQRRSR